MTHEEVMENELLLTPKEFAILLYHNRKGNWLQSELLKETAKAQLAKAKQHYEQKEDICPWCNGLGKRKVALQNEVEICELCDGTGKIAKQKRLDRPELREKIASKIMVDCGFDSEYPCPHAHPTIGYEKCHHLDEEVCMWQREQADQILALIPDIEKAKREERERIIALLEDWGSHGKHLISDQAIQALQLEEG